MDSNASSQPNSDLEPVPSASWLVRNGPYVLFLALIAAFFYYKGWITTLDDVWSAIKVCLGLGLVIFIHELGHFAVAKWCDVHVETFSIGFGPPLPGCCFQRGETTYMIALFPLGGYVKMVGEGAENDEEDTDPRSFKNKTVWQRMAIISAGVVMNVLMAFACFVFVYMTHGAERIPGVVDRIEAGSPAWKKGIRTGDVIHQIGVKDKNPWFDDLQPTVMLSKKDEKLEFAFSPPDTPEKDWTRTMIEPRLDKDDKRPMIGIVPPAELELIPEKLKRDRSIPICYQSAAAKAEPPFEFGDRIIGSTDPDHPDQVTILKKDPRDPSGKQYDYFEFERRLKRLAGQPMTVRVVRAGVSMEATPLTFVDIKVPPAYRYAYGMRMRMGPITAVRDNSAALKADVKEGDIIDQVEVVDNNNEKLRFVTNRSEVISPGVREIDLDPARLPFDLEKWAKEKHGPRQVTLTVLRTNPLPQDGNPENHKERQKVPVTIEWDDSWRFDKELPLALSSPMSVPELSIAYRVETTVEGIYPGSPAEKAGVKKGDVITELRSYSAGKAPTDEPTAERWTELKSHQWAFVQFRESTADIKKISIRRKGYENEVTLDPTIDETWASADIGLFLMPDTRLQKAESFGQALAMGMETTTSFITQIYGNLRAVATKRLSPANFAGPGTIASVAFAHASDNLYRFILFMGVISINLAVINFLPIPVLDGGHMVFLVYEKIRGRPASEHVRVVATYVGLALIFCLMIFVVYLDFKRHM